MTLERIYDVWTLALESIYLFTYGLSEDILSTCYADAVVFFLIFHFIEERYLFNSVLIELTKCLDVQLVDKERVARPTD